jgi:hypothetical protein
VRVGEVDEDATAAFFESERLRVRVQLDRAHLFRRRRVDHRQSALPVADVEALRRGAVAHVIGVVQVADAAGLVERISVIEAAHAVVPAGHRNTH